MADNSGNFWGGFLLGAAVGGVVGALVAIKLTEPEDEMLERQTDGDRLIDKPQTSNEFARRNLEKKIAQLNAAIDSVSQELSTAENKNKNGRKQASLESLQNMTGDGKQSE
jgi:predicted  nucleic acid-binding Zn-ribbon protein